MFAAAAASALWENPDRRPTQPIDPTVGVIRVEDAVGKPRALAVHYACHPVALMGAGAVSRDFPGAMVDYIEQQLGEDCLAMFLQGAQGDLDPYDLHNLRGENRFNIARQAGISLGKGALRVAAELKQSEQNAKPRDSQVSRSRRACSRFPTAAAIKTTEVGLLTVVIKRDLALVAIPGEPFIQHQLDLTAKSPLANTFILGLAYHGQRHAIHRLHPHRASGERRGLRRHRVQLPGHRRRGEADRRSREFDSQTRDFRTTSMIRTSYGTAARRNPRMKFRNAGTFPPRAADLQRPAARSQLPPRNARNEPVAGPVGS